MTSYLPLERIGQFIRDGVGDKVTEQTQTEKLNRQIIDLIKIAQISTVALREEPIDNPTRFGRLKNVRVNSANQILKACKKGGLKFVDYKLPCTIPYETTHIKVEEIEVK